MATCVVLIATLLIFTSCPRVNPEAGDAQLAATATHPWEKPDYQGYELQLSEPNRSGEAATGGKVEARPERGPQFPEEDTLDISKLDGYWQVVGLSSREQQSILPASEQDTFIFQNGRSVIYHGITNWKDTVQEGTLKKLKPGVLGLKFGTADYDEFYAVLYRDDFLFLWNYANTTGFWMARLPEQATERMGANRFETDRGQLVLTDVVATSFSGRVTRDGGAMTINGFYSKGILCLRWEEDDRSGGGYAMFIVGPDWQTLKGAWWVDDYEAEPFGGKWDGTRD